MEQVPVWPFVWVSVLFGSYVLTPYFALWKPDSSVTAPPTKEDMVGEKNVWLASKIGIYGITVFPLCQNKKWQFWNSSGIIAKQPQSYKIISETCRAHSETLRTTLIEDQLTILHRYPSKLSCIPIDPILLAPSILAPHIFLPIPSRCAANDGHCCPLHPSNSLLHG